MIKPRVLIAGAYNSSDAYPNVKYRVQLLLNNDQIDAQEFNTGSPSKMDYETKFGQLFSLARLGLSLFIVNIRALTRIVRMRNCIDTVYIPYPAIPLLWLLSLLPKFLKPSRVISDVFISLYDTVVMDRQLLEKDGLSARTLFYIERRALKTSTISVTDTKENSTYYSKLFKLDPAYFTDLPLSIDQIQFKPSINAKVKSQERLNFLFIGTLVPLHGIDVLFQAISLLDADSMVDFTFVGDGQDAQIVRNFLKNHNNSSSKIKCTWIKEWQNSQSIASFIENADICIGILNPHGKSQRVWPIKNYLYMACGRALLTTKSETSSRLAHLADYPSFYEVDTHDPAQLAEAIEVIIRNRDTIAAIGANARQFYESYLSEICIRNRLLSLLSPN